MAGRDKCMGWRGRECAGCLHLAESPEDEELVRIAKGDVVGFGNEPGPRACPRREVIEEVIA
jgi:hypothetical protein